MNTEILCSKSQRFHKQAFVDIENDDNLNKRKISQSWHYLINYENHENACWNYTLEQIYMCLLRFVKISVS